MAYTTVNKSTEHFDAKIYTGNGSSQTLDMDNLGLLWMKNRTETSNHCLFDSVRGGHYTSAPGPILRSNGTTTAGGSDITSAYGITFGSSSSTIGSDGGGYNYNQNGKSYVGWQWRANGTGSANTDGSINSTVSVNTTAGFSICKWTGTGSAGTIGHGLGAVPKMIIIKDLSNTRDWFVYHASIGNNKRLKLNDNVAEGASTVFNNTTPTSSVFSIDGSVYVNNSGSTYIAYCFAEKTGYSKFGSYIGIANDNGAFVYTGFAPKFIMVKASTGSSTYSSWSMFDTARSDNLNVGKTLYANKDYQEGYRGNGSSSTTSPAVDLLSNGFKFRKHADEVNNSSTTYVYMAFGQSIVGSNNIPATAR